MRGNLIKNLIDKLLLLEFLDVIRIDTILKYIFMFCQYFIELIRF